MNFIMTLSKIVVEVAGFQNAKQEKAPICTKRHDKLGRGTLNS